MKGKRFLYYYIFFSFLLLATACGSKKESEEGVLTRPEMVSTLLEVYVAEQKIVTLNLPRDSAEFLFKKLNAKVLESKNVSDSLLKKSFDYYLANPKQLEEIYSALVDSLNLREQRSNTQPSVK